MLTALIALVTFVACAVAPARREIRSLNVGSIAGDHASPPLVLFLEDGAYWVCLESDPPSCVPLDGEADLSIGDEQLDALIAGALAAVNATAQTRDDTEESSGWSTGGKIVAVVAGLAGAYWLWRRRQTYASARAMSGVLRRGSQNLTEYVELTVRDAQRNRFGTTSGGSIFVNAEGATIETATLVPVVRRAVTPLLDIAASRPGMRTGDIIEAATEANLPGVVITRAGAGLDVVLTDIVVGSRRGLSILVPIDALTAIRLGGRLNRVAAQIDASLASGRTGELHTAVSEALDAADELATALAQHLF